MSCKRNKQWSKAQQQYAQRTECPYEATYFSVCADISLALEHASDASYTNISAVAYAEPILTPAIFKTTNIFPMTNLSANVDTVLRKALQFRVVCWCSQPKIKL